MAIRCLFLVSDGRGSACEVLKTLGALPVPRTNLRLQQRYCTSGSFIACPVFRRVEEGLLTANLMRVPAEPAIRRAEPAVLHAEPAVLPV